MRTITVPARGYYDTITEHVALLDKGDVVRVLESQLPAPCASKQGRGFWGVAKCRNSGLERTVFIDT